MNTEQTQNELNSDPAFYHLDVPPFEPKPEHKLKTELQYHQQLAIQWLIQREKTLFQGCYGGLLMDEAGLGKTLEILTMIKANPCPKGNPTLIIVPLNLIEVWKDEIKKHFQPNTFTLYFYYGPSRKETSISTILNNYDILITTYGTVQVEFKKQQNRFELQSLFSQLPETNGLRFGRIILDEAHTIRNRNTTSSHAIRAILSKPNGSVWAITATPIYNRLDDFYPIFDFLRIFPFSENPELWNRNIIQEITSNTQQGIQKLKEYLIPISLRRTKSILQLNEISHVSLDLELSNLEKEFYNALFHYSRERVKKLLDLIEQIKKERRNQHHVPNDQRISKAHSYVLTIILRLRQACLSPSLVIQSMKRLQSSQNENSTNEYQIRNAIQRLQQYTNSSSIQECSICMDNDATHTAIPCGHMLCQPCWNILFVNENVICPFCRNPVESSKPIQEAVTHFQSQLEENDDLLIQLENTPSTKIQYLIDHISQFPNSKCIIVSQWKQALILLEKTFRQCLPHISFCRLDGSKTSKQRSQIIEQFQTDPTIQICLISLTASSEGITLTAATKVFHLDPWWNEAKDYQVSNRIHRIGQEKPVFIYRLCAKNTIEDNIIQVREKKRKIEQVTIGNKKTNEDMSWINNVRLMFNITKEEKRINIH